MVELKTDTEIAAMREAGRVVARALDAVARHAEPGVPLRELDAVAAGVIADAGARPSFLNYQPHFASSPFPGVICTSVNDVVVHGIPDDYRLAEHDLLSVDCGAELGGFHGDSAVTIPVGGLRDADAKMLEDARSALRAGIEAATAGARMGDMSEAIGRIGRRGGYGIPADFGGHGVGRRMHEDPPVPNEGRPGKGFPLRPGLVIALEPMFMAGGRDGYRIADDGWSLCTIDGSRAVHVEHTVAITEGGPVVLTAA
ncbi:MAG: type I methionyl aminopeptidase [Pseudonocardiaceae bacterium]|nr:type I methionyl aminopeptidase [Pseudonocardiaceae bacterium]